MLLEEGCDQHFAFLFLRQSLNLCLSSRLCTHSFFMAQLFRLLLLTLLLSFLRLLFLPLACLLLHLLLYTGWVLFSLLIYYRWHIDCDSFGNRINWSAWTSEHCVGVPGRVQRIWVEL